MSNERWKCPKCGVENDSENTFCGECGTKRPEIRPGVAERVVPKQTNQNPNSSQDVKGESVNQKEVSKNKVKIVTIICCLIAFIIGAGIYIFEKEKEAREQRARDAKIAEEERKKDEEYENKVKPVYQNYLNEVSPKVEKLDSYITQLKNLLKLQDLKYDDNKKKVDEIVKEIEAKKADIIKAEEERKKQEAYRQKQNRKAGKEDNFTFHVSINSRPQGAECYWRIKSATPDVKKQDDKYLAPTPYESMDTFNIKGLTYKNSADVQLEIRCEKQGYYEQKKVFDMRSIMDEKEISAMFMLIKEE